MLRLGLGGPKRQDEDLLQGPAKSRARLKVGSILFDGDMLLVRYSSAKGSPELLSCTVSYLVVAYGVHNLPIFYPHHWPCFTYRSLALGSGCLLLQP